MEIKTMHMRGYGYVLRADSYRNGSRVRLTGIARLGGDPFGRKVTLDLKIESYDRGLRSEQVRRRGRDIPRGHR